MNGMKYTFTVILLAALLPCFVACTPTDDAMLQPVPIGFSPNVETQTRGTDLTADNLPSFGVLAYFTQGGEFNPATSTPNFMYNRKVEKNGGSAWTYSPLMYWPANENDKISFFAYAPHNPTGLALSASSAQGYPVLTYTVPETEAEQSDLLLARPVANRTAADGTVSFPFSHVLTRVILNVEAGEGFPDVTINSLSIQTKKTGSVAFTSTTEPSDWFAWSNIASGAGNDVTCRATLASPTVIAGETQQMATFFLLPVAAVSGGTSEKAKLSINYTMNGSVPETQTAQVEVNSMTNWLPATSLTYTLKVTRTGVTVSVGNIGVWTGTDLDVDTGGEIAEGYKAEDIKTGDYYYSDGTWSDGGYRMLIDGSTLHHNIPPLEGKTCIGIVYANGKTGVEHEDKISDYSDTGLVGEAEIKGYVVRLDAERGRRSGTGSKSLTAFDGYKNTKSLAKADTQNTPELGRIILDTSAPPLSTSGWYVMSLGQTAYAYEKKEILNKSRSRVKTSSGGYYGDMDFSNLWTSTYQAVGNKKAAVTFRNGIPGDRWGTDIANAYFSFTF